MFGSIALLAMGLAQPQTAPNPSSPDPIVVEGRDRRQTAADYVDKLLPSAMGAEIGRFEDALCPKVIGLAEPYNAQVIARIREVAKATSIDLASGDCVPNLVIVTARDKRALIDSLRRSHPGYFTDVATDQLMRLASSDRPYASWQVTDVIAADGMPVGKGSGMPAGTNGAADPKGGIRVDADFARLKSTMSPSRLRKTVKPRVLSSIVVVETKALNNVTTGQLADFALVKAMLPTERRERPAPASSILSLFNTGVAPDRGPQSVTWWDVAFLKSLRSTPSDKNADIQKAEIRDQMVREIKKAPGGQP